jgi:hypothetical protein
MQRHPPAGTAIHGRKRQVQPLWRGPILALLLPVGLRHDGWHQTCVGEERFECKQGYFLCRRILRAIPLQSSG